MNRSVIQSLEILEGKRWDAVKEKTLEVGDKVKQHLKDNWKKYALGAIAAGTVYGYNKLPSNTSASANTNTSINKADSIKATDDVITPKEPVKTPEPVKSIDQEHKKQIERKNKINQRPEVIKLRKRIKDIEDEQEKFRVGIRKRFIKSPFSDIDDYTSNKDLPFDKYMDKKHTKMDYKDMDQNEERIKYLKYKLSLHGLKK